MPFLMVRNEIKNVVADVIVQLADEESTQAEQYDLGNVVINEAVDWNAKYLIHVVGPIGESGFIGVEKMLYSTYMESMKLADEYRCESIAFPLLSCDKPGYPKDKVMKVAITAISDFLMDHDILVYMVMQERDPLNVDQNLLACIEEYIDENYENYEEDNNEILKGDGLDYTNHYLEFESTSSKPVMQDIEYRSIKGASLPNRSLESLIDNLDETFSQMLLRLIDERGLKDSTVYKRANVDRRHFSKIRNDIDYVPTKKTVIAFAIALELSMDESIDLMKKAGFAFSTSSKFDVIIQFFIENKYYDIYELNEALFTYGQPILGE